MVVLLYLSILLVVILIAGAGIFYLSHKESQAQAARIASLEGYVGSLKRAEHDASQAVKRNE